MKRRTLLKALAATCLVPFGVPKGMAEDAKPKDPEERGKWTVTFGKANPMPLLQISSAVEPIDKPAIATMTVKVGGEFFEPDMVFHEMDVTVRLDEKPYVVRDALCTGMRVVRSYDDPSYTQVFMQP